MEIVYLAWVAFGIFAVAFVFVFCFWWYHRAISITDRRLIRPDGKVSKRDSLVQWLLRGLCTLWCFSALGASLIRWDQFMGLWLAVAGSLGFWIAAKKTKLSPLSYIAFGVSQVLIFLGQLALVKTLQRFVPPGPEDRWLVMLVGVGAAYMTNRLVPPKKNSKSTNDESVHSSVISKPKPRVSFRIKSGVLPGNLSQRYLNPARCLSNYESSIKRIVNSEWWICRWASAAEERPNESLVLVRECSKGVRAMVWFEVERLGDMLEWTMYGSELRRSNAPAFNQSHFAYSAEQNREDRAEEPMLSVGQAVWDVAAGNLTNQDDGMKVQGLVTVAETTWLNALKEAMEDEQEASSRAMPSGFRAEIDPTGRKRETVE